MKELAGCGLLSQYSISSHPSLNPQLPPRTLTNPPHRLNQAKTTLRSLSPTASIHLITMNALTATPEQMTAAISSISNLQISILVNNVGGNPITLPAFRLLSTYTCSDVDSVINQNARFMARLTALMLPLLTRKGEGKVGGERKQRSLILNMSSAGLVGLPYLVMYSATKAFNLSFSIGLARELSSPLETQHIDVLAIIPGEVHSQGNSHGVSSAEPTWIEFGECIVQKTDAAIRQGRRELRPWMMHDVKDWIFGVLSEGKKTRELGVVMRGKRDAFNGAWEREVKSR
jgi:17beta-estradiol 17-dehydrogenase / very-long-chain 3-oxoacyl-CoA reductase